MWQSAQTGARRGGEDAPKDEVAFRAAVRQVRRRRARFPRPRWHAGWPGAPALRHGYVRPWHGFRTPPPHTPTHNGSYMGLEQRYCSVALFDQSLVWFACGPWGGWRRMALPTPLEVRARLARACGIAFVGIQRVRVWRAEAGPCCLVSPPCSAGCQRLRRWCGVYVQPLLPACRGGLESVGDGATRCGRPLRP